jgi:hypothetical protein
LVNAQAVLFAGANPPDQLIALVICPLAAAVLHVVWERKKEGVKIIKPSGKRNERAKRLKGLGDIRII